MEFNDMIRARRQELHKTLEEVAAVIGVGKATVQRWESGSIKNLRKDKIDKLAEALEITPVQLLGWDKPIMTGRTQEEKEMDDYLNYLKFRPEMRMLFSVSKNATKDDIMRAVAIIEALKKSGPENV